MLLLGGSSTLSLRAEPAPTRIENSPIENFFLLTTNVLSGATPANETAFAELQKRGVKTIISVDGAKPDANTARHFGIRYVHLPIGYDGISTNRQLDLIKAAQTFPGPVFVHCHHGEHRGPTAAAILCMGTGTWKNEEGFQWLKQAGTATNYSGLYASVENFRKPDPATVATVATDFPEHAKVSNMIEAMVAIDERLENLKAMKKSGYRKSESHPDIVPVQEALLLHELFKELSRTGDAAQQPAAFLQQLKEGEEASGALYSLLNEGSNVAACNRAFDRLIQNCASCHRKFRN